MNLIWNKQTREEKLKQTTQEKKNIFCSKNYKFTVISEQILFLNIKSNLFKIWFYQVTIHYFKKKYEEMVQHNTSYQIRNQNTCRDYISQRRNHKV